MNKSRLVAREHSQSPGIDFNHTSHLLATKLFSNSLLLLPCVLNINFIWETERNHNHDLTRGFDVSKEGPLAIHLCSKLQETQICSPSVTAIFLPVNKKTKQILSLHFLLYLPWVFEIRKTISRRTKYQQKLSFKI